MDNITLKHVAQMLPFSLNRRFNIVGIEFITGEQIENVNARVQRAIDNLTKDLPKGVKVTVRNSSVDGCSVTIDGQEFKNDYQF